MITIDTVDPQHLFRLTVGYFELSSHCRKSKDPMGRDHMIYFLTKEIYNKPYDAKIYGIRLYLTLDFMMANQEFLKKRNVLSIENGMMSLCQHFYEILSKVKVRISKDGSKVEGITPEIFDREHNKRLINSMQCINSEPL